MAAALDITDGVISAARLAAGGVGTRPWRLRASEHALAGQRPGRAAWEAAGRLAIDGAQPLSGNRFKVELLRRAVARTLEMVAAGDGAGS